MQMVQGMAMNAMANPGSSALHYSTLLSRKAIESCLIRGETERHGQRKSGLGNLFFRGKPFITGQKFRVETGAGRSFTGGGREKRLDASIEGSQRANDDLLIFFFQLDLATQQQFALNLEQYGAVQQLRNKSTKVEEELVRLKDANRGSSLVSEAQEQALRVVKLREEMQCAIKAEDYAAAAVKRDEISKLEAESLSVSAKALAYLNVQYAFRLGQKIRHKIFGYRGVICGLDPVCCESSSWMETANVKSLSNGPNQPFYCVLVDDSEDLDIPVTYVAEENLVAPEKPDKKRFDHPYASFLFYGVDTAGDFIPIKQLREKYHQDRYEAPFDSEDEEEDE